MIMTRYWIYIVGGLLCSISLLLLHVMMPSLIYYLSVYGSSTSPSIRSLHGLYNLTFPPYLSLLAVT